MQENSGPPPGDVHSDPDDRLESWKRIAAYLQRDVRTLRRWERNEGLPVHRQMHEKLGTVYAYRSELDAWRAGRTLDEPPQHGRWKSAPRTFAVLAGLALLAVLALLITWSRSPPPSALAFSERDWVLIAQFENRTGDPVFHGTLEHALERELSNSPYVHVVPRERVNDTLSLMQLSADTPVDAQLAREIALRDGGVRALVDGRIEQFGGQLQLSASLRSPGSGLAVAGFERRVASPGDILPAIAGLAREVRKALGEPLPAGPGGEVPLARVTTPSLQALRLYSLADTLMQQIGRNAQALPLLEQALSIDPDFASAHAMAWYILDDLGEDARAAWHIARAVELSEGLADRERYFILATADQAKGDFPAALEKLELLVQLHPDHAWAVGNLAWLHVVTGDRRQAQEYRLRRAQLRPNNPIVHYDAARVALLRGDEELVALHQRRVEELVGQHGDGSWMLDALALAVAARHWMQGDLDATRGELQKAATQPQGFGRMLVRSKYLALGDMQAVKAMAPPAGEPDWLLAIAHPDDPVVLGAYLDRAQPSFPTAVLLARAGRLQQAHTAIDDPASPRRVSGPYLVRPWRELAEGELALARGELQQATERLESATRRLRFVASAHYFLGCVSLARAYQRQGALDRAIRVLEDADADRHASIFNPGGTISWMHTRLELASLYRRAGRGGAAGEVERELRQLLRLADASHPILRALEPAPAAGALDRGRSAPKMAGSGKGPGRE